MEEKQINQLRLLQLKELEILKDFTRVLDGNNLHYFLGFGTLLGVVRHQGFVPWDDDIDVFMPRPDYEKLLQNADQIIRGKYRLIYHDAEKYPNWFFHFSAVENPEVKVLKRRGSQIRTESVIIDVFALDGLPDSPWKRWTIFFQLKILHYVRKMGRSYANGVNPETKRSLMERIVIWLLFDLKLGKFLRPHKTLDRINRLNKKYPYEGCKYVYALTFEFNRKRLVCKREWFGEGAIAQFEGSSFRVPADSHQVLTKWYGDYMTPPPESSRGLKHIVGFVDEGK